MKLDYGLIMELDQVALHSLEQPLHSSCLRERKKGASSKSPFLSAVAAAAAAARCSEQPRQLHADYSQPGQRRCRAAVSTWHSFLFAFALSLNFILLQRGNRGFASAGAAPPEPRHPLHHYPGAMWGKTVEWALPVIQVPASTVHYHRSEEIRSELRIHPHGMSLSVTPGAASVLSALTTHTCANSLAGSRRVSRHCPGRLRGESLLATMAG